MTEPVESMGQAWLAHQQAVWKALLPALPGADDTAPTHQPLEAQFAELRDTCQASVAKWAEFAKDAGQGELPTPARLREMFAPASWSGRGSGVMDYKPTARRAIQVPVLIGYGQIGRYTITDLQEDRSMLRNLLALGVDVYAVDWGSPGRGDRWLTFEDYVDVYLNDCVEHICKTQSVPAINLLGICEGGVFSLCCAALYPGRVKNLILTITPVDFHRDQAEGRPDHGFINLWTRSLSDEDIERLIDAHGNLPGELMSHVFSQMTPGATMSKYNVGLLDTFDDEKKLLNFLRMDKWLADRPHHPGEAAKQLLVNLYKNNEPGRGEFRLGGRTVDLADIRVPVLNVFAKDDHIIPPKTTQALRGAVGTKDYTEIGLDGGHIGVFVSGKSQGVLSKGIVDWLKKRD